MAEDKQGLGLAEKHDRILSKYLGLHTKPTKAEYERSKAHTIPSEWNPGQSQNWWVLGCGVRFAYGDTSETQEIINRLRQERDEIGVWGSEQHSPKYWGFHIRGRLAILKNTHNEELIELIEDQIADLFKYCELAMSPDERRIFACGMRGTGGAEYSSYELWYLYVTYILGRKVPKKKYWKEKPGSYAWITDPWVRAQLMGCVPKGPVGGIRSKTHFMNFGPNNKLVWTEDDQHPSTVFRGAGGFLKGKYIAAPVNYDKRYRGKGSGSMMVLVEQTVMDGKLWELTYYGPYNDIAGAQPTVFKGILPELTSHKVWDMDGLRDADGSDEFLFSDSPFNQEGREYIDDNAGIDLTAYIKKLEEDTLPPVAEERKSVFQRIKDAVKNFFNRQ